jgi:hypothetical protein
VPVAKLGSLSSDLVLNGRSAMNTLFRLVLLVASGVIYKVGWCGGSTLFSDWDDVILTTDYGFGKMICDADVETADVWLERVDE